MPVSPKIKAGCGAAMLFSAGAFCGLVGFFLLLVFLIPRSEGWKREESKDFLARHFAGKLKLTDEQKAALKPGFDRYLDQRWQLRSDYLKEDRDILEQYLSTLEPDLTPEQIERVKAVKDRWWKGKRQMVGE